jgi:hypothetical protein
MNLLGRELMEKRGLMVQQGEQIAHRLADDNAAGLVALKCASATAENLARLPLRQPKRLA